MIYNAVREYLQVLFQLRYRRIPGKSDSGDASAAPPESNARRRRASPRPSRAPSTASSAAEPVDGEMVKFLSFTRKIQIAGVLVSFSAYPGSPLSTLFQF